MHPYLGGQIDIRIIKFKVLLQVTRKKRLFVSPKNVKILNTFIKLIFDFILKQEIVKNELQNVKFV